jgi:hypothetical protein
MSKTPNFLATAFRAIGKKGIVLAVLTSAVGLVLAQDFWFGGDPYYKVADTCEKTRDIPSHAPNLPTWTNTPGFEQDTFTFARLRYDRRNDVRWGAGYWWSDAPDSDLNLSFRLQQITSLKVNPDGRVVNINEKELADYPWVYMVEPGRLRLKDKEVTALRNYLMNGGFLMADDFWGTQQWGNFEREIQRVLPGRSFVELPMDHAIFHCVFDFKGPKNSLLTLNGQKARQGMTYEVHDGEICNELHVRAILDDKGRIMVIATHNCDNGDGWEREGEDDAFFHEYSEKRAYPLAINIIYYAMTH